MCEDLSSGVRDTSSSLSLILDASAAGPGSQQLLQDDMFSAFPCSHLQTCLTTVGWVQEGTGGSRRGQEGTEDMKRSALLPPPQPGTFQPQSWNLPASGPGPQTAALISNQQFMETLQQLESFYFERSSRRF